MANSSLPAVFSGKHPGTFGAVLGAIACTFAFLLTGCGGDGVRVSGRVTFDGNPIPEGTITFIAPEDASHQGQVQAAIVNGDFVIESSQSLRPGTYQVAVRATRSAGQVPPEPGSTETVERIEQYIPVNFNSRTELSAEIPADVDALLFELKAPPIKRGSRR